MTDLIEIVEKNRFVGREFLLWAWFETELFETNIQTGAGHRCAMWLEQRITLAFEAEAARIDGAVPSRAREAKEALRQGKLPLEARFRATTGEHEFSFTLRADTLSVARLKVPAELDVKKDELADVLKDRMALLGEIDGILDALFADFLKLRVSSAWVRAIVPALRRFAEDRAVDFDAYQDAKRAALADVRHTPPPTEGA